VVRTPLGPRLRHRRGDEPAWLQALEPCRPHQAGGVWITDGARNREKR
jgi:hypothetical protein